LFDHRVLEELYHVAEDPDCLVNLVDDPKQRQVLVSLRDQLASSLQQMNDPVAPLVAAVDDEELRENFMAAEDEKSSQLRNQRNRSGGTKARSSGKSGKLSDAISVEVPRRIEPGASLEVIVRHRIPERLGEQELHVTLKSMSGNISATQAKRIHREVTTVTGDGETVVRFDVPADLDTDAPRLVVAAFVGEDFEHHLQHVTSRPILVSGRASRTAGKRGP
jgi:hypothetical protein